MEIAAIAAATLPALVPYLIKGGEKLAEKVAEEGFNQRGRLWVLVKDLFEGEDLIQLDLLAESPNDPKIQGKIEGKLEEKLKTNQQVAMEIAEILKEIPSTLKDTSLSIKGDGNKVVQDVTNSSITIH